MLFILVSLLTIILFGTAQPFNKTVQIVQKHETHILTINNDQSSIDLVSYKFTNYSNINTTKTFKSIPIKDHTLKLKKITSIQKLDLSSDLNLQYFVLDGCYSARYITTTQDKSRIIVACDDEGLQESINVYDIIQNIYPKTKDITSKTLRILLSTTNNDSLTSNMRLASSHSRKLLDVPLFYIIPEYITWYDARAQCIANGDELASIHCIEEHEEAKALCTTAGGECHIGIQINDSTTPLSWTDGSVFDYGLPEGTIPPWLNNNEPHRLCSPGGAHLPCACFIMAVPPAYNDPGGWADISNAALFDDFCAYKIPALCRYGNCIHKNNICSFNSTCCFPTVCYPTAGGTEVFKCCLPELSGGCINNEECCGSLFCNKGTCQNCLSTNGQPCEEDCDCCGHRLCNSESICYFPGPTTDLCYTRDVDLPIAEDGGSSGTTDDSLTVTGLAQECIVDTVTVTFDITHTWVSNLVISLEELLLINNICGSDDDLMVTVTDSGGVPGDICPPIGGIEIAPPFATLRETFGDMSLETDTLWNLLIRDTFGPLDGGTLHSWTLCISAICLPAAGDICVSNDECPDELTCGWNHDGMQQICCFSNFMNGFCTDDNECCGDLFCTGGRCQDCQVELGVECEEDCDCCDPLQCNRNKICVPPIYDPTTEPTNDPTQHPTNDPTESESEEILEEISREESFDNLNVFAAGNEEIDNHLKDHNENLNKTININIVSNYHLYGMIVIMVIAINLTYFCWCKGETQGTANESLPNILMDEEMH